MQSSGQASAQSCRQCKCVVRIRIHVQRGAHENAAPRQGELWDTAQCRSLCRRRSLCRGRANVVTSESGSGLSEIEQEKAFEAFCMKAGSDLNYDITLPLMLHSPRPWT